MSSRMSRSSSTISTQGMSGGQYIPVATLPFRHPGRRPSTLTSASELDGATQPGAFDHSREVADQLNKCVPFL